MNEYYKVLVMFQRGEIITHKRLLNIKGITEELIARTEKNGYIRKIVCDDNEIGYFITKRGIEQRDS